MKKNQTILGIDLGDKNMKIAVLSHRRGITTVSAHEIYDIENFMKNGKVESHDYIRDCIKTFMQENRISKPKVVLTIPNKNGDCSYTKIFDMKKLSKKEHEKALPIEIEDRFPIKDFNDFIKAHQIIGTENDGKDIKVLATLAKKEVYNSYMEIFNDDKLSKLEVIIQSKTVSVMNTLPLDDASNITLDIGFNTTEIIVSKGQKPLLVKSINFGGALITEMISRMMSISLDEAEELKITKGAILEGNEDLAENEIEIELSNIITPQMSLLFSEIDKTINIAENQLGLRVQHIYTAGGTSNLKYLNEHIEKKFGYETSNLFPYFLKDNQDVGIKYGSAEYITAFGSSFQAFKEPVHPLSFTPKSLVKAKRFVFASIILLLVALVGINGTLFIQLKSIEKTLEVYNKQHVNFQDEEMQVSSEMSSLEAQKEAAEAEKNRKEQENYQLAQLIKSKVDHVTYLEVIRDVVPVTVQTNKITIDKFDFTIEGLAGNYSDIGYFVKELSYQPKFKDIDFSFKAQDKTVGKYILRYFSFTITGKIVHP